MEKLKPAYEAKGFKGHQFAKAVGLHPSDLSRITQNRLRPTPQTLGRMMDVLSCPANAIATPQEFGYPIGQGVSPTPHKRPENRVKPAKTVCRTTAEKRGLFMAACDASGMTMQQAIEQYMDLCIKHYLHDKQGVA